MVGDFPDNLIGISVLHMVDFWNIEVSKVLAKFGFSQLPILSIVYCFVLFEEIKQLK